MSSAVLTPAGRPSSMPTDCERPPSGEPSPAPPAAIVITLPSSPDVSPNLTQKHLHTPPLHALESHSSSDILPRVPLTPPHSMSQILPISPFNHLLANTALPPPGPDHYDARRALWWSPGPGPLPSSEPNPSRRRLEALLAQPSASEDDRVWDAGVDRVWRGLIAGARLKHRLPLALVIKVLQAGWTREGTWPKGAVVPDSDDASRAGVEDHAPMLSPSPSVPTPAEEDIPILLHTEDEQR